MRMKTPPCAKHQSVVKSSTRQERISCGNSHLSQAGIVSNERDLLSQIGKGRKSMPAAQEMISGRSQQAAGFHSRAPLFAEDFFNRTRIGQKPKIPGRAQAGEKIHPGGQSIQRVRDICVRI